MQPAQPSQQGNGRPFMGNPQMAQPYGKQSAGLKKARDAETLMGIKGMGIVASILVFISFILFAMYLIPGLTDTVKMVLMFVVSISLTAVGLFFWLRKKESLFFLSLGACGIGAIYISLFVTNVYFHMIEQIPLYVLLLIWAAGVLYLSRIKPLLFEIIGLSGIIISILLGVLSCAGSDDGIMLGVLTIYLVVGVLAFMLLKLKDTASLIISNVAACIGTYLIIAGTFWIDEDRLFSAVILIAFSLGLIILNLILVDEKRYHYLPLFGVAYTGVFELAVKAAVQDDDLTVIIALLISVIIYIGIESYFKLVISKHATQGTGKSIGIIIWEALLLIISAVCVLQNETLGEYIGVFILFVPLIIYGFLSDDQQSKISAFILYCIVVFDISVNSWAGLIYVILSFGIFILMMLMKKNQYNALMKLLFYIAFFIGLHVWFITLTFDQDWDLESAVTFLLFLAGAISFGAGRTRFGRDWLTDDDENAFIACSYIINAILMIESLVLMLIVDDNLLKTFIVLIAIMLFTINSVKFLKSEESVQVVYVGIKYTILLIVVLNAYNAVNYVISISVFALATLIILLGFKMKLKSLRIYGLVTTMIFAVKLVMFDIKYDNVLGNALSFFISGLICFGISALYSIADKKINNGGNDAGQM